MKNPRYIPGIIKVLCIWFVGFGIPSSIFAQEYGEASYYSDNLHGQRTASGERYNKYSFTGAHRTLGFGTMVRVTRIDDGRSVTVKINDRGPNKAGRIVDLSRAAAEQIGLTRDGFTQVKLEVVSTSGAQPPAETVTQPAASGSSGITGDRTKIVASDLPLRDQTGKLLSEGGNAPSEEFSPGQPSTNNASETLSEEITKYTPGLFQMAATKQEPLGFGVQVGAFFTYYRLLEGLDELHRKGFENTMVHNSIKDNKPIFRILLGPYQTRQEAMNMRKKALAAGQKGILVDLAELK
ncbi:MAG: septal ring lytic transglycosylase RlpA family protein [Bacteroidia bacterium]|nr:septal ring lytic transglycosylase RlpA family protein [Bacteroidia bacterium]